MTHQNQETYYAKRAAEHDAVYAKPERQADLQQLREEVPAFFADKKVLDVGCGTGYWTTRIAGQARTIHGVDINTAVLDIAKERSYACPSSFEQGSYYDLSMWQDRYQGVFGGFVYSHVKRADQTAFMAGLLQMLQPGGVAMLIDNRFVEGSSTPIHKTDKEGNTYQKRVLHNGETFEILKNFPVADEWAYLSALWLRKFEYIRFDYYWMLKIWM